MAPKHTDKSTNSESSTRIRIIDHTGMPNKGLGWFRSMPGDVVVMGATGVVLVPGSVG